MCPPGPDRNAPKPAWQFTVRPWAGTKRRCTPAEWSPRLGMAASPVPGPRSDDAFTSFVADLFLPDGRSVFSYCQTPHV